jgi:hypothetical protein
MEPRTCGVVPGWVGLADSGCPGRATEFAPMRSVIHRSVIVLLLFSVPLVALAADTPQQFPTEHLP